MLNHDEQDAQNMVFALVRPRVMLTQDRHHRFLPVDTL